MNLVLCILLVECLLAALVTSGAHDRKGRVIMSVSIAKKACKAASLLPSPEETSLALAGEDCKHIRWNDCGISTTGQGWKTCSKFEVVSCKIRKKNATKVARKPSGARIIDGRDALAEETPYVASIYKEKRHLCAGAIIHPFYVLTAASCIRTNTKESTLTIILGDIRTKFKEPTEQAREVESIIRSPVSDKVGLILLKLKTPMTLNSNAQPAILPQQGADPTGDVTVSSWGETLTTFISTTLQVKTLPILSELQCRAAYKVFPITKQHICTVGTGKGACASDAGGPMVQPTTYSCHFLFGIFQTANKCTVSENPGVGSRISEFLPWIRANVPPIMRFPIDPLEVTDVHKTDAKLFEFPFQVRIVKNKTTICSGSIIDPHFVLTAAACLISESAGSIRSTNVIAGDHDSSKNDNIEQTRLIAEFIPHRLYDNVLHIHDIALIRLDRPLTFNHAVRNVTFADPGDDAAFDRVFVTGWGSSSTSKPKSTILQKVPVTLMDNSDCELVYGCIIASRGATGVCTIASERRDTTCKSDFGSPLTAMVASNTIQVFGIASFRLGCNDVEPLIATYVPKYSAWMSSELERLTSKAATRNEFSYQLVVFIPGNKTCGGALLNDRFVLTAAQCFTGVDQGSVETIKILAGKINLSIVEKAQQEFTAVNIMRHEEFNPVTHANDIALVELSKQVLYTQSIQHALVSKTVMPMNPIGRVVALGWGQPGRSNTGLLVKHFLHAISTAACKKEYTDANLPLVDDTACLTPTTVGDCIGTPGAPLIQRGKQDLCHTLVGTLTLEKDCEPNGDHHLQLPNLFIDVARYKPWIEAQMVAATRIRASKINNTGMSGGTIAQSFDYTFHVLLLHNGHPVCGGAILNEYYVITSAFCAVKIESESVLVKAAASSTYGFDDRDVSAVLVHPDFDIITRQNDIALLHVSRPFTFNQGIMNISISPPNFQPTSSALVSMLSWSGSNNNNTPVKILNTTVLDTKACWTDYGCGMYAKRNEILCVNASAGGLCEGDEGNPLTFTFSNGSRILVGVASFRIGCAPSTKLPNVYTSISKFYNWIRDNNQIDKIENVKAGDFPTQVQVLKDNVFACVGTIIGEMYILVAAHCVFEVQPQLRWSIIAGIDGLEDNQRAQRIAAKYVVWLPNYNHTTKANDIGIIQLTKSLLLSSSVQVAMLPPEGFVARGTVVIGGWNMFNNRFILLRKLTVPIVRGEECKQINIGGGLVVSNTMICSSPLSARVCLNPVTDIGGPMIKVGNQNCITVVALPVKRCGSAGSSNVYTEVSKYSTAIDTLIATARGFDSLGGKPAAREQFPFQLRFADRKNETICVGALLSFSHAITAASCVASRELSDVNLIAGDFHTTQVDPSEQFRRAHEIIVHGSYNNVTLEHNLAIVTVEPPFTFHASVSPIELGSSASISFPKTVLTGWGKFSQLESYEVRETFLSLCKYNFRCSPTLDPSLVFCILLEGGIGPGYIGGPLTLKKHNGNNFINGIVSYRSYCTDKCYIIVTNLGGYRDWILYNSVGGKEVDMFSLKYHAFIYIFNQRQCEAAILGMWHVLTSAACLAFRPSTKDVRVIAGARNFSISEITRQNRSISKYIIHPKYNSKQRINNIALVELTAPFVANDALEAAVVISDDSMPTGIATLSGSAVVSHLRQIPISFITNVECNSVYFVTFQNIGSTLFCSSTQGPSFCFASVGSPLTQLETPGCYKVIGISNFFTDCSPKRLPGIYTRASAFYAWIMAQIPTNKPLRFVC